MNSFASKVIAELRIPGIEGAVDFESIGLLPALNLSDPELRIFLFSKHFSVENIDAIALFFREQFANGKTYFTIREEQWQMRPELVIARVNALIGLNQRVFARKLIVQRIDKTQALEFFTENHPNGFANAYFKLALTDSTRIVCAAIFSKARNIYRGDRTFRSHELIRFATRRGITVTGGLSRLLAAFHQLTGTQHLVTTHDLENGTGAVYTRNGFQFMEFTASVVFWFNAQNGTRIALEKFSEEDAEKAGISQSFSAGNAKFERFFV